MEKVDPVRVIDEARGFLAALTYLCVPRTIAWIAIIPMPNERENAINDFISEDQECIYGSKYPIDGNQVRKFIRCYLFDRLPISSKQKRDLEWQLNEYIDLAGDADSGNVEFGRLRGDDIIFLEVEHPEFKLHGNLLITLAHHLVKITLGDSYEDN